MSVQTHISELQRKHAQLDHAIASEYARPMPDIVRLRQLKSQKLKLKDMIYKLAA